MAKNYFFPLKKSKILRKISRSGRSSSDLDLRNIPYEKNKLLLNENLGDFMHFETIFFVENDFFKPTPLKCGIFRTFFLKPSLRKLEILSEFRRQINSMVWYYGTLQLLLRIAKVSRILKSMMSRH